MTKIDEGWVYLRIKVLKNNKNSKILEHRLREKTILSKGYFNNGRIENKDSFICKDEGKLIEIFDSVFN